MQREIDDIMDAACFFFVFRGGLIMTLALHFHDVLFSVFRKNEYVGVISYSRKGQ